MPVIKKSPTAICGHSALAEAATNYLSFERGAPTNLCYQCNRSNFALSSLDGKSFLMVAIL